MHSSLIFLVFSFITGILSAVNKYKCGKDLKFNQCQYTYYNSSERIFFVKPCGKGERCVEVKPNDDKESKYQCVKTSIYEPLKEGDSCFTDEECESKICHEGKCMFLPDYTSSCKKDYQCGYNSYCDHTCLPIKKKGDYCDSDSQCEIGTLCGQFNLDKLNTCVEMFSLSDGSFTTSSNLCQSGWTLTNSFEQKYCASITILNSTCDEKNKCKYLLNNGERTEEVTYPCTANNEGQYFCAKLTSSQEFKDYVKVFKEEVKKFSGKGVKITNINKEHFGNEKVKNALVKYAAEGLIYTDPKDENEKCINEYWYQQLSSSFSIKASIGLFLLSLLLF